MLECLQKSLKIADKVMQTGNNVSLFVAILDQYLYYYQQENEAVRFFPSLFLFFSSLSWFPRLVFF